MVDALVSFVLDQLATVIQDEIQQEVRLVVGVRDEVKKLTTTFKVIQAVLTDAEKRQITDELVKFWYEELKEVAYDMDDLLDEWNYEILRSQIEGPGTEKVINYSYFHTCFSCFMSNVSLRHDIGVKIKKIRERLEFIEMEKNKYRLIETKSEEEKPLDDRPKTSSLIDVSEVCGRAMDKEIIISKLLGESSSRGQQEIGFPLHLPNIISIVGMGGLGKTTLSQLVFNDAEVENYFEQTIWVCVSHPFDLIKITKAIIGEIKNDVPNCSEWNALHHCLVDCLKEKRFLLVLDDVWSEDEAKWEPLRLSLKYGASESRVLVTTRNERVVEMMGAKYIHYLQKLSDDDCSSLLCRIAFFGREEENNGVLKEIGMKISLKCKGLPLAAKTLGSLLRFKRNQIDWQSILESEMWELEEVDKGFLQPALLLSYSDLPSTLKGCFVYCSSFPKDHEIQKDTLIKLWMALGFLKSTKRNEHLEMIGEDYFNKLAMLSFFQDFVKDDNGNIVACKMHDLVHDFAQSLSKNECSLIDNGRTELLNSSSKIRHLTVVCEEKWPENSMITSIGKCMNLRTLQLLDGYKLPVKDVPSNLFHHLRCLRVLCLSFVGLENLSSEVSKLIHLRYLDLSKNSGLKQLPESIVSLYNLETLNLVSCGSLHQLPREIGRMMNLRHLGIRGTYLLSHLPQGIRRLSSLQTLGKFIVAGGASEGCKISELKDLNLLQGDLSITGLCNVDTVNEAFGAELWTKRHLHTLDLLFDSTIRWQEENQEKPMIERTEGVLEGLQPHSNLVNLTVNQFFGSKLPSWISSDSVLFNLKTLELRSCNNCNYLPALGQLPYLEVLRIIGMEKLKHIGFEFYTHGVEHVNRVPFPKLKELHMNMANLELWEIGHGEIMPWLRDIKIECPNLKALPALGKLPSLEDLKICDLQKLRYIGSEFLYEIDEVCGGCFNNIVFPKLKCLDMSGEKFEWEVGVVQGTGDVVIMPCLITLSIKGFLNLKTIGVLSKLPFLETLKISSKTNEFIEYIRHDGDSAGDHDGGGFNFAREILFPNLKTLELEKMVMMEELRLGVQVMPSLSDLQLKFCKMLKVIPHNLPKLESLTLWDCPLLHELTFFSSNFKYLEISYSSQSSLPQGLERFNLLQRLTINYCDSLTCMPEGVMKHLTSLQELIIKHSSLLEWRCRERDWGIISHIPNITIGYSRVQ